MHSNGRLKLGPKRKEGIGLNRIHKLHQEQQDKEVHQESIRPAFVNKLTNQ